MNFDESLRATAGEFGRWQKLLSLLMGLYAFSACFIALDTIFTAANPASWCHVPRPPGYSTDNISREEWRNLTVPWQKYQGAWRRDPCHMYRHNLSDVLSQMDELGSVSDVTSSPDVTSLLRGVSFSWQNGTLDNNAMVETCKEYEYDRTQFQSTIITEWDLVCKSSYLASVTKSVAMAGMMVGCGVSGFIADKFGRRKTMVVVVPLSILFKFVSIFSPNLTFYNSFNFITLVNSSMCYVVIFTLAIELVGPSRRALVGTWFCQAYALAYLLLTLLGYLIKSWRTLVGAITALSAPALALIFIVPESPRWLLAQGDVSKARDILRRLTHLNGREFPEDIILTKDVKEKSKDRIWHLCSSPKLALHMALVVLSWFTAALTYYGLTMNMGSLAGNMYINMTISGVLELIAYFVSEFAIGTRLGRKIPTSGFYILAGASMLLTLAVPVGAPLAVTALTTFGRFCVCCLFNAIYIWTVELLPTGLRNSGLSTASSLGKIGAVIAPFTEQLARIHQVMPIVMLGGITLLCGVLILLLPETRGRPLPQTMADMIGSTSHGNTPDSKELEAIKT